MTSNSGNAFLQSLIGIRTGKSTGQEGPGSSRSVIRALWNERQIVEEYSNAPPEGISRSTYSSLTIFYLQEGKVSGWLFDNEESLPLQLSGSYSESEMEFFGLRGETRISFRWQLNGRNLSTSMLIDGKPVMEELLVVEDGGLVPNSFLDPTPNGGEFEGWPKVLEGPCNTRFVRIPDGNFEMGSPNDELGRQADEVQSLLSVPSFYMQTSTVTNEQFRKYKPCHYSGEYNGASLDGDQYPVVNVNYDDAIGFCRWLSRQDAVWEYWLPTEVEWEYACRAGTKGPWWWGDNPADAKYFANVLDAGTAEKIDGILQEGTHAFPYAEDKTATMPVESYRPNPFGLFDMIGNVWECCIDVWPNSRLPAPLRSTETPIGGVRIARGGAFDSAQEFARAANRVRSLIGDRDFRLGFRMIARKKKGKSTMRFYAKFSERPSANKTEEHAMLRLRLKSLEYQQQLMDEKSLVYSFRAQNDINTGHSMYEVVSLEELDLLIKRDPLWPFTEYQISPVTATAAMVREAQAYLGEQILSRDEILGLESHSPSIDPDGNYTLKAKKADGISVLASDEVHRDLLRRTLESQRAHLNTLIEVTDENPVGIPNGILLAKGGKKEVDDHLESTAIYPDTTVDDIPLLTLRQTWVATLNQLTSSKRSIVGLECSI